MNVPEKLINFRVYNSGADLVGTADITLPKLSSMTQTVKGAGIAGEIDSPVLGHYSSTEVEINFRTIDKDSITLASPKGHHLDLRGAQQVYDSSTGEYVVKKLKLVVRGVPKTDDLGKLDVGATTDTKLTLECDYVKLTIDGKTEIELDKYNYIANIGGVDYLADVRDALGLN